MTHALFSYLMTAFIWAFGGSLISLIVAGLLIHLHLRPGKTSKDVNSRGAGIYRELDQFVVDQWYRPILLIAGAGWSLLLFAFIDLLVLTLFKPD